MSSVRRDVGITFAQLIRCASFMPCGKCFPANRVRPIAAAAATAKALATSRIGAMPVKRTPNTWSFTDVFDRVLDKGVVIPDHSAALAEWTAVPRLFIVDAGNEALYRSLRTTALSNDSDVEIFYDRRQRSRLRRRHPAERRMPSNVDERIRRNGFAVVRPAPPPAWPGLTRWTA
jgi:hypothetical protein